MTDLEKLITEANISYWDADKNPIMTDLEYDTLKLKHLALSPTTTQTNDELILANVKKKFKHDAPLLSLNKADTIEGVQSWMKKVSRSDNEAFKLQGKFDGIACKLYSDNSKLVTRGSSNSDALYGYDISHILPIIEYSYNIQKLTCDHIGELVVPKDVFLKFKSTVLTVNETEFVNERAMASGITNRIDIKDLILNGFKLTFVIYDMFDFSTITTNIPKNSLASIIDTLKRGSLYPLDGVVVKVNDINYCDSLGVNSKFPKYSIAYKFPDELKTTVIESIELQYGKGKITPVANVTPVEIAGITLTRASLHNWARVLSLDIWAGDTVSVIRAKDTIPHIVDKVKSADTANKLTQKPVSNKLTQKPVSSSVHLWCEYCQLPLVYEYPELYCKSPKCKGSFYTQIENSLKIIGFDNIGEKTIKNMVDICNTTNILDVLTLSDEQLNEIPRYSVNRYKIEIDKLKNNGVSVDQLMAALNIPQCGLNTWNKILNKYDMPELISVIDQQLTITSMLMSVPDIGNGKATSIYNFFQDDSNLILYNELSSIIKLRDVDDINDENKTIYLSGKFKRSKADIIKTLGAIDGIEFVNTISNSLDILVFANINGEKSKKMQEQQELGKYKTMTIMSTTEFNQFIKELRNRAT